MWFDSVNSILTQCHQNNWEVLLPTPKSMYSNNDHVSIKASLFKTTYRYILTQGRILSTEKFILMVKAWTNQREKI